MEKNNLNGLGKEQEAGPLRTIKVCNNRMDLTEGFSVVPDLTLKSVAEIFGMVTTSLAPVFRLRFMNRRTGEVTFDENLTIEEFCLRDQDVLSVCVYYTG